MTNPIQPIDFFVHANSEIKSLGDVINTYHYNRILKSLDYVPMNSYSKYEYYVRCDDVRKMIGGMIDFYSLHYNKDDLIYYTFYYKSENTMYIYFVIKNTILLTVSFESNEKNSDILELNPIFWVKNNDEMNYYRSQFEEFISQYDKINKLVDINYYHLPNGQECVCHFRDIMNDIIFTEAYPYIENLDLYIDDYLDSKEPILFLYGPSGTGKSRLVRYIIQKMMNKNEEQITNVLYSSDERVLVNSEIFVDYMLYSENHLLVLEDMDNIFTKRVRGDSPFMHAFLSTSDGIIQSTNRKKMIFACNIEKYNDIDEALLRDGRCYDAIPFQYLTFNESKNLINKIIPDSNNIIPFHEDKLYSIADIYKYTESILSPLNGQIKRYKKKQIKVGY